METLNEMNISANTMKYENAIQGRHLNKHCSIPKTLFQGRIYFLDCVLVAKSTEVESERYGRWTTRDYSCTISFWSWGMGVVWLHQRWLLVQEGMVIQRRSWMWLGDRGRSGTGARNWDLCGHKQGNWEERVQKPHKDQGYSQLTRESWC